MWFFKKTVVAILVCLLLFPAFLPAQSVIRFNQLGFTPSDLKVLVAASKDPAFRLHQYKLLNLASGKNVLETRNASEKDFGRFGPFEHSFRINISSVVQPGNYRLVVNDSIKSDTIRIGYNIYKGTADFCLQFLRQQRCVVNSFVNDSIHAKGDYSVGGPLPDTSNLDVRGGWHNAGNNSQDVGTAAAITWYLLSAYDQYPSLFNDDFSADGNAGKNVRPDIMDEVKWGFDWLIKMHPSRNQLYQQAGGEKGAASPLPVLNSGKAGAAGRPVYAISDSNSSTASRMAAMLSAVFSNGSMIMRKYDANYAERLVERAVNTYQWAIQANAKSKKEQAGINTALAAAAAYLYKIKPDKKYLDASKGYLAKASNFEPRNADSNLLDPALFTNGMADAAGKQHCVAAANLVGRVWQRARNNAFFYGLPITTGSNKMVVSLALKCQELTEKCSDTSFEALRQANIDWLFGCNPWGVTMVSGFPGVHAVEAPFNVHNGSLVVGGLVNGPVTLKQYQRAEGASLINKDAYADFQSDFAIYHDDKADYITNQPGMVGTAALISLLASREQGALANAPNGFQVEQGGIIRGDSAKKRIALVFTADRSGPGAKAIPQILAKERMRASFFITNEIIKSNPALVRTAKAAGHYIGPFGNAAMANCSTNCEALFASEDYFNEALQQNLQSLRPFGITPSQAPVYLSPGHKYNQVIAGRLNQQGLSLVNATPGTISLQDNILPGDPGYFSSDSIFQNIMAKARQMPYGLNGYILVFHTDVDASRNDKFYLLLPLLLQELKNEGYEMVRVDEMLGFKRPPLPAKGLKKRSGKALPAKKKKKR